MKIDDLTNFYIKLLRHPHDEFRTYNQELYAATRDAIAHETNLTSEDVQNYFEGYVVNFPND